MTRGVSILLLLLSSWMLAIPALRASSAPLRAAVVAGSGDEARAAESAEHVAAQCATPEVPRAPFLARLPSPQDAAYRSRWHHWLDRASFVVVDRREDVRRVQLRRRLPRLGGDDPPWA
ncbi:MAG TPA: hypothetical protein VEQ58_18730 [Polyangiaceae bacterium]|nr:hypothetical protein [Polyangiaceae bacterium]